MKTKRIRLKDKNSLKPLGKYISECQNSDGSVAWEPNGKIDPWDHVESLMGLNVLEMHAESKAGFEWLKLKQEPDGSWYSEYKDNKVINYNKETNFAAYISSGALHYYLHFDDKEFLEDLWPFLKKSVDFVLSGQSSEGDILWAKDMNDKWMDDSLVTGCSSIYKSLRDFERISEILGKKNFSITKELLALQNAIRNKPERFDRTWKSKSRYSMDWYYPILCGIYDTDESKKIIKDKWEDFVVPGLGCKCVEEEPWVTIAETCELILALNKIGERKHATNLYDDVLNLMDEKDNLFWTGFVYKDHKHWPVEKPSWTAAAVILAANSLFELNSNFDFF